MSFFPCSFNGHRYRGSANHVYPAIVEGVNADRRHWRMCSDHTIEICEYLSDLEVGEGIEDFDQLPIASGMCMGCGRGAEDARQVFVTAYGRGEERRDFYGRLHAGCAFPTWFDKIWGRTAQPNGRPVAGAA